MWGSSDSGDATNLNEISEPRRSRCSHFALRAASTSWLQTEPVAVVTLDLEAEMLQIRGSGGWILLQQP